jgi:hypothetical protein
MTINVLLLGRLGVVVDDVSQQLHLPNVAIFGGTGIDDVRATFAAGTVDVVIMGAGIDLETRLEIVREVFRTSDTTTVHMKDVASGPAGFMPFVRSILVGLQPSGAVTSPPA